MTQLPPSVHTFSHDSWSKLLKFYEQAVAADIVTQVVKEVAPVIEEDEDATPSV